MLTTSLARIGYIGFKKRWSHRLSLKKPEVLTKKRSENLSKKNLDAFFEMVKMQYESDGLLDDFYAGEDVSMRIFNLDETGCSTNPTGQKLFFSRKSKQAYMLTPTCGKAMYTVLFTGNANGDYLAPFVVYMGKICTIPGLKVVHMVANMLLQIVAG